MQHSADSPLFTTRIAVVESDRATAEILHTFFRLMELEIAFVEADFEAVDTIRRFAPAVVLIDFDLPDLRALDLVRDLRDAAPEIAIILMTADPSASSPPGELLIAKPRPKFEELLRVLEEVLEFL